MAIGAFSKTIKNSFCGPLNYNFRIALLASDIAALGQAFIGNTEGQCTLHPDLIDPVAQQIIELAQSQHALGWKVNGAGGLGGSMTLLLDGSVQN